MKVYTREALIRRLKISMVIGLILDLAMLAFEIAMPILAGIEFTIGILLMCVLVLLCAPILGFCCFGMSFNFGKTMLGMIAPIPILSMFIEYFKGLYYGVKAIIVIVKKLKCS